jgi:hypothetical protein
LGAGAAITKTTSPKINIVLRMVAKDTPASQFCQY